MMMIKIMMMIEMMIKKMTVLNQNNINANDNDLVTLGNDTMIWSPARSLGQQSSPGENTIN